MILRALHLSQFRCFDTVKCEFDPRMTVIIGPNAKGKTSILEGIFAGLYGSGFRESREKELIRWDQGQAVVGIDTQDAQIVHEYSVLLRIGQKMVSKSYAVNRSRTTFRSYRMDGLHAVLFAPQHINIMTGSPARRRDYIDTVLSLDSLEYRRHLRGYQNALRRRNKILEFWQDEQSLIQELHYWNDYLKERSAYIVTSRKTYCDFLNVHQTVDGKKYRIEYVAHPFDDEQLRKVQHVEMRMRSTMIGPQKDEFRIFLQNDHRDIDVQLFGSRSQQRMAVFWLKLNELLYHENETGRKPLLLLDDIFSELDGEHRQLALHMVQSYQTVLTTTEEEVVTMLPAAGKEIRL